VNGRCRGCGYAWRRTPGRRPARPAAQVYTELVVGLGEAIVSGLVPGSAMSAVAKKDALDEPRVRKAIKRTNEACFGDASAQHCLHCCKQAEPGCKRAEALCPQVGRARAQVVMYPSKSDGMFVPESLIFRSDSNGARAGARAPLPACEAGGCGMRWRGVVLQVLTPPLGSTKQVAALLRRTTDALRPALASAVPWHAQERCGRGRGPAGEDLEGYAGAGLYDSITMDATELRKVDYAADRRGSLTLRPCTLAAAPVHAVPAVTA